MQCERRKRGGRRVRVARTTKLLKSFHATASTAILTGLNCISSVCAWPRGVGGERLAGWEGVGEWFRFMACGWVN